MLIWSKFGYKQQALSSELVEFRACFVSICYYYGNFTTIYEFDIAFSLSEDGNV